MPMVPLAQESVCYPSPLLFAGIDNEYKFSLVMYKPVVLEMNPNLGLGLHSSIVGNFLIEAHPYCHFLNMRHVACFIIVNSSPIAAFCSDSTQSSVSFDPWSNTRDSPNRDDVMDMIDVNDLMVVDDSSDSTIGVGGMIDKTEMTNTEMTDMTGMSDAEMADMTGMADTEMADMTGMTDTAGMTNTEMTDAMRMTDM